MKGVDVWTIAEDIEKKTASENQQQIIDFIDGVNGKTFTQSEMIEKVVAPIIGIVNANNRNFTIDLIQQVVDDLQKNNAEL